MKNFINKKNFIRICSVMLVTAFPMSVHAEDAINDIKHPLSSWANNLLAAVEAGPNILSRDEPFDVALPPLNDSQITKDELAYLQEIAVTERTEDALLRIYYENSGKKAYDFFVKEGLLASENDKTLNLLRMIDADHVYFILERKKHFSRPRPNRLDTELVTSIPNPSHPAYPSGHSSQTYMVALVLSDFDPENSELYKQFSVDVAHRREIAGVHYPSDSEAGRKLAVDVLKKLREIPVFEKKYHDAKASYVKPDLSSYKKSEDSDVAAKQGKAG